MNDIAHNNILIRSYATIVHSIVHSAGLKIKSKKDVLFTIHLFRYNQINNWSTAVSKNEFIKDSS